MSMLSLASNRRKVSNLPRSPLPHLPQDLIFSDILTRLPAKPLLRFQCVSKAWLAVISSPEFVKSHLDFHKNDEEDKVATFAATDDGLHLSLFSILAEEDQCPTNCSSLKVPEVAIRYLGTHNGLLCFRGMDQKVVVCNPCTRKIKKIDDAPGWPSVGMYGFGYDQQNCDYKVVYACRTQTFNDYDVLVYSFRSGSWENIPNGLRAGIVYPNIGVHINGTLNWSSSTMVARDNWESKIVSFNLTTNSAVILSGPKPERSGNISLCESRGFLLASWFQRDKVSVWKMREFGVENSWTKLACIQQLLPKPPRKTSTLTPIVVVIYNRVSLMYVMNNTNLVMKVGEHLRVYTPEDGKSKWKIEECRLGNRGFKAILFRETLAPPPCLSDEEQQ
ncbi:PREDICTED: F-box/kelch-repeat protein At3g23880-like [Ipomoea nil]|uniref:F-box/kelch-repeat protein At3g23880-like n=1 Tax=Ipomoea nil TaxID=35883 RepID=UPI0009012602|nr:PREDICTED: F-box/kelch-repeat protein At3g23880-like [Ipomoea nil]